MRRDGALVTDTGSRAPQTCRGNAVIRPGRGGRSRRPDSAPGEGAPGDSARGDSGRGDSGAWWAGDAPTGETAPPGPTTDATGAGTAGGAASGAVAATQVGEPGTASLPPLPPSTRERRPREPWIPEPPPFRTLSGPDIAGIVLLGALGIGVLVVLGLFVLNRFDQRDPVVAATPAANSSPAPSAAVTPPSSPGQPSAGPTTDGTATGPGRIRGAHYRGQLNTVTPAGVDASCTSRPTQNADGGTTPYDAELVLDGNPETAWRCPGPAVGERLTIRFDQPTAVAELGIVNGYAKGRVGSGGDQYRKNRRVERVRYIFDGDRWVDQQLDPTDRSTQTIRIPATTTGRIIVEIREVSPGERDATAISELTFAGPQQG